jgi:stress-induced-phosphoprotein 1
LKLDPENALLKSGLADAKRASMQPKQQSSPFGPQFLAKLATDPRTRGFLAQPDFLGLLQQVQRDPNNIGLFLKDPRMQVVRCP